MKVNHFDDDTWKYIDGLTINLCRVYNVPREDTQDVLQGVRLDMLISRYVRKYNSSKGSLKQYLYPRIKGEVKDYIRKSLGGKIKNSCFRRKIKREDLVFLGGYSYKIQDELLSSNYNVCQKLETRDLLDKIFVRIPNLDRSILKLHYLYGVPMWELATLRGITPAGISYHMKKARKRARDIVKLLLGKI